MDSEPFDEEYYARAYGGSRGSYEERATPNKWLSMCDFIASLGIAPKNALDAGCADGAFLASARSRFSQTVWRGCEVSTYALEKARGSLPGMTLLQGSATALPFSDGELDLVTALDVLEHVTESSPGRARARARPDPERTAGSERPGLRWPCRLGCPGLLDKDPTHVHKCARKFWLEDRFFTERFEMVRWQGLWRYYLGRYWHARATVGRQLSPAIIMAWRRRPQ